MYRENFNGAAWSQRLFVSIRPPPAIQKSMYGQPPSAQRRFAVSKPWGDARAYDVGIEHEQNFLRVQVKSTTLRSGAGYRCQFMPNHKKKQDYSLKQIDVFAAYVIPENAWYLIPAVLLLGKRRKCMAALSPLFPPAKKASYCYEGYREAWTF